MCVRACVRAYVRAYVLAWSPPTPPTYAVHTSRSRSDSDRHPRRHRTCRRRWESRSARTLLGTCRTRSPDTCSLSYNRRCTTRPLSTMDTSISLKLSCQMKTTTTTTTTTTTGFHSCHKNSGIVSCVTAVVKTQRFKIQKTIIRLMSLKTEIVLQLHIKMPVISLVVEIRLKRHIKMIVILISTKIGKVNKLSI